MDLVALDIGGTNARFCIARLGADGAITLSEPVVLDPHAHTSFESAWARFRDIHKGPLPARAALAIAAPVDEPEFRLANIDHWLIHRAGLEARMGVEQLMLINDFGAMGHAVAHCAAHDTGHDTGHDTETHFRAIAGPSGPLPAAGTLSIVGPGTGLGVAHLWRDGKGFSHVQSTEGGHTDFAPVDAVDDAILARLRARHSRVSTERIVSGPAIVDIYETLAALEGRAIVPADAAALWARADAGDDPLASAAAERFCLSLGSVVGDLALAQGACGVVLAGGVAQRQAERIIASGFHRRFLAKGRFAALMARIPIRLITHPQPGLLGAAAAYIKEHAA